MTNPTKAVPSDGQWETARKISISPIFQGEIAQALADEAAPLAERIERLTRERDDEARDRKNYSTERTARLAAESRVTELEKQLGEARTALNALIAWAEKDCIKGVFQIAAVHGYALGPDDVIEWDAARALAKEEA